MTAEQFWFGVALGAVIVICCYELGDFIAKCSAVRESDRDDRPSAIPEVRR